MSCSGPSQGDSRPTRRSFLALTVAAAGAPTATSAAADKDTSPLVEAQVKAILATHAARLSAEQKADIKRLVANIHKTSQVLRTFPLEENSEPALVFRVYRGDRR